MTAGLTPFRAYALLMVVLSRLVTRQLTWFRDNAMFKWVNAADGEESVLSTILSELDLSKHQGTAKINLSRFMMLFFLLAFGHSVLCFLMRTSSAVQSSTPSVLNTNQGHSDESCVSLSFQVAQATTGG